MKEAFPTATIVRPADVYGHEDRFLNFYASLRGLPFHLIPVLDRGNLTHKLPVYVSQSMSLSINTLHENYGGLNFHFAPFSERSVGRALSQEGNVLEKLMC